MPEGQIKTTSVGTKAVVAEYGSTVNLESLT